MNVKISLKKGNLIFFIYLILFELLVITERSSFVGLGIIAFNCIALISNKKYFPYVIISSFLLNGEVLPILNIIVCIIFSGKKIEYSKPKLKHLVILLTIFFVSLIQSIINNTIINVIFYSGYLFIVYFLMLFIWNKIKIDDVVPIAKEFVVIETIAVITQLFMYRSFTPGDLYRGTLDSAHWLANFLLIAAVCIFCYKNDFKRESIFGKIRKDFPIYVCIIFLIYFADAKTIIGSFAIGIVFFVIFEKISKFKYPFIAFIITFYLLIFVFSCIYKSDVVVAYMSEHFSDISRYLYSSTMNGKFNYISGVFTDNMFSYKIIFGNGIGQFGSRVSNLFAYSVMYRGDSALNHFIANNFSPHYLQEYANYISYYTSDFVENIRWISAVLSYPFNNVTSWFAETGAFGLIGIASIVQYYLRDSKGKFLAYYFVVNCFFDIYFDNFPVVGIVVVMIAATRMSGDKYKQLKGNT